MKRLRGALSLIALVLGVVFIMMATLFPVPGDFSTPGFCIFCGERGGSDFLSNIILFAPFGLALAVRGVSGPLVFLIGGLFSLGIETLQIDIIAGRDASLGDLIANTLGAFSGWLCFRTLCFLNQPPSSIRRSLGATAITAAVLLAGLSLFHPRLPDTDSWFMQWTAHLRGMDHYDGTVTSTRLGILSIPPGRIDQVDTVKADLFTETLVVDGVAGSEPARVAPIVSIFDGSQSQVFFIGARGGDLIFQYGARADRLGLDHSTIRVADAFVEMIPGAPFRLVWRGDAKGYCFETGGKYRCGIGLTVGDTWSLVRFVDRPPTQRAVIQILWLWVVFIPAGVAASQPRHLVASVALMGLLLTGGSLLLGFAMTPLYQIAGAIPGLVTGAVGGALVRASDQKTNTARHGLKGSQT
ncbi:MAG: VanZ family protein [Gemmatimonadota bacterium]|jgi:hypothetical protein|nr:VanZ family protein [Gemmatimonadota bacterium]